MVVLKYDSFIEEKERGIKFFFDMDGVLADFEKGVEEDPRFHEVQSAKEDLFKYVNDNHPEVKRMHIDDVKPILPDGNEELKKLYDRVHDTVHEIAEQKGFFINLKPLPGAREMLAAAQEISGQLPDILTAPVDSEWCAQEKRDWMKKHFNGLFDKIYVEKQKEKLASSKKDILIDDRIKYSTAFTRGGGSAILHSDPDHTIEQMEQFAR